MIIAILTKLIVEDGHAAIRQVLECLEQELEALGEALRRCRIHNLLQRLDDLNLLVTSLTVALDSIKDSHLRCAIGIEWYALTEMLLLVLELVLYLVT